MSPPTRSQPLAGRLDQLPVWPAARRLGGGVSVTVSVHRGHCHLYGICQQEAPDIFQLSADGRLTYDPRPDEGQRDQLYAAARACPMQAITITERRR